MKHSSVRVAALIAAVLLGGSPQGAEGQLLKKIKQKAKEQVTQRVDQRTDEGIAKGVEKTESLIVCVVTDPACVREAEAEGKEVRLTDEAGNAAVGGAAVALRPGEGAWANYDFLPGERVILAEDFTADNVGDFPRRFEFRAGNMQVVEWEGQRWLSDAGKGRFYIGLPETLPERFTVEFDLAGRGNPMALAFDGADRPRMGTITLTTMSAYLRSGPVDAKGDFGARTDQAPVRIRIAVDAGYVKLYANEQRVLNVPNAELGRSSRIFVHMNGWSAEEPRMLTNLRIAAGGNDLYNALSTAGRVATQGIFFDTGSDRIRPESTPMLGQIAALLQQHPELSLAIEGHTDDVGDTADNQLLSQGRAEAVLQCLVEQYGIEPTRLAARGLGEAQPVAGNDTPEGRQQNRRVELVRL